MKEELNPTAPRSGEIVRHFPFPCAHSVHIPKGFKHPTFSPEAVEREINLLRDALKRGIFAVNELEKHDKEGRYSWLITWRDECAKPTLEEGLTPHRGKER